MTASSRNRNNPLSIAKALGLTAACLISFGCERTEQETLTAADPAPIELAPEEEITESEDERLAKFFDEVFERELTFSPIFEAQLGRKTERYGEWDDASDAADIARNERREADLARLDAEYDYTALNAVSQTSYDVFVYENEQAMRNFAFRNNDYIAHHTNSYALYLPVILQNLHRIEDKNDANAYISRLVRAEEVLNDLAERLTAQTASGVIAPAFVYPKILSDLENLVSGAPFEEGEDNAVFTDFQEKIGALTLSEEDHDDLLRAAKEAMTGPWRRGYARFQTAVEEARDKADGNDGVWEHANGAAYYENRIQHFTTLDDLTADAIHQIGLKEVARLQEEMEAIKTQVGFEGTLQEFSSLFVTTQTTISRTPTKAAPHFLLVSKAWSMAFTKRSTSISICCQKPRLRSGALSPIARTPPASPFTMHRLLTGHAPAFTTPI